MCVKITVSVIDGYNKLRCQCMYRVYPAHITRLLLWHTLLYLILPLGG